MTGRWAVGHAAVMTLLLVVVPFIGAPPAVVFGVASVFAFVVRSRPRGRWLIGVANVLTATRVVLISVGACSGQVGAFIAFGLVWALDGLDGAAARRLGEASEFGAQFDLETDALFVASLSATLTVRFELGAWVLLAGLLRYVWVLARALLPVQVPTAPRRRFARGAYSFAVATLLSGLTGLPLTAVSALAALGLGGLCLSFLPDFLSLRPRRTTH